MITREDAQTIRACIAAWNAMVEANRFRPWVPGCEEAEFGCYQRLRCLAEQIEAELDICENHGVRFGQ